MVGGLFSNVVPFCVVWILPVAGEGLPEDRVQWLLYPATSSQSMSLSLE